MVRKTTISALGVLLVGLGLSGDETRLPGAGIPPVPEISEAPTHTDGEPFRLEFKGRDEVSSTCSPNGVPSLALPHPAAAQAQGACFQTGPAPTDHAPPRRPVLSFAPKTSPPSRS